MSNAVVGYGNPAAKTADTSVAHGDADNEGTSRRQRLHSRNGWGGSLRLAATAKTVN